MAYFIKLIIGGEYNYGIKSKELLAVIYTLNEWRVKLIYLPEFDVVIDQ